MSNSQQERYWHGGVPDSGFRAASGRGKARRGRRVAGWLASALVLAAVPPAQSREPARADAQAYVFSLTGQVVTVTDGDTLTLLVGKRRERVRLASIDAPEVTKDRARPGQPMAQQSRKALADLVAGRTLTAQCFEQDRYQRNVCDVMLPDGSTANQRQVARGLAWANMEKRGRFLRDGSLRALEREARRDRLGIWQRTDAVAPWVWRYQCWQLGQCS